jgi:hypothetical protein
MELQHALSRGEWTPEYVKQVCEGDVLSHHTLDLLRGDVEIVRVRRVVDCDIDPEVPEGHRIVKHDKLGQIEMDELKLDMVWPDRSTMGFEGMELDFVHMVPKYLVDKKVPNKNLRDYLLRYPHLVPKNWGGIVLFWGTLMTNGMNDRWDYVPGMQKNYGTWQVYDRIVERNERDHRATTSYTNPAATIV